MQQGIVFDVLIFLAIAVTVTPLCQRLRVSPVLGYLLAGSMVGPFGLALMQDGEATEFLGQLGIIFLLFMIGLDLSLERLRVIRRYIFGLGTLQVVTTAALIDVVARLGGVKPAGALVLGVALAFSSTAFVLQILSDKGELASRTGRVAVAVLILQDMAVVPLLVVLPLLRLGDGEALAAGLGVAALKAAGAIVVILLVGRLALRPLFQAVARTHAPEVFIAAVLLAVIGTAWATGRAGLSVTLGAFLAGMMIAATEYRHQVEADILPFRGLLMGLFFLSVGMTIDVADVVLHAGLVVGGVAALIVVKTLVIFGLARLFRFAAAKALALGLLLAQGGEFAFVVLGRAAEAHLLPAATVDRMNAVIALSMALTPLLAAAGTAVTQRAARRLGEEVAPKDEADDLCDHVIIAGFGRVGRTVAAILGQEEEPWIAIDRDPHRVAELRRQGQPVFFGDLRKQDVLKAVGAHRARALVITVESGALGERMVPMIRRMFPHLTVLVRARNRRQQRHLEQAGAHAAVPEALEGSLQLAGQVLRRLGTPADAIHGILESYRRDDYAKLEDATADD
jgi:CPA2 family monovalent cation:H+ antiporter-2